MSKHNQKKECLVDILKQEINKLKLMNDEYQMLLDSKKVINTERKRDKTRYFLKDGSTYVVGRNYKYLYDAKTRIITYEFANGQVERTFPTGVKEIRHSDGSIVVRCGEKDYDLI